jgi:hypothetical protein
MSEEEEKKKSKFVTIVYMDDILIFAESQKELQERTKQVLQRL